MIKEKKMTVENLKIVMKKFEDQKITPEEALLFLFSFLQNKKLPTLAMDMKSDHGEVYSMIVAVAKGSIKENIQVAIENEGKIDNVNTTLRGVT